MYTRQSACRNFLYAPRLYIRRCSRRLKMPCLTILRAIPAFRQPTDRATLRWEGEIIGYTLSPQAVTENALASKTRLTITVRVKYTDNKNDKNDIDQSFSAYQDFDSSKCLPTCRTSFARKSRSSLSTSYLTPRLETGKNAMNEIADKLKRAYSRFIACPRRRVG